MIPLDRIDTLLDRAPKLTIGLVGDLFLDRYLDLDGEITETSLETGLDAYQVVQVRNRPGALGTVLANLASLGFARIVPVSVIGQDGHGDDLVRSLGDLPVELAHVLRSNERLTPTYIKPLLRRRHQSPRELNRLDVRTREPVSPELTRDLLDRIEEVFFNCDGLIVLDQIADGEGVVGPPVRSHLTQLAEQCPEKLVLVDSRAHLDKFEQVWLKGNQSEVVLAAGGPTEAERAVVELARRTGHPAFCTAGADGMLIGEPDGGVVRVAGIEVPPPIDIVGAGDAATSGLALGLLAGASLIEAAALANLAAAVTVGQIGTTGTARRELLRGLAQQARGQLGHRSDSL